MPKSDDKSIHTPSRRQLFKAVALPLAAVGLPSFAAVDAPAAEPTPYRPTFFTAAEWAFVTAACDRLIPADAIGPGALELGVPEFLDRHMQTPYAAGDIWYMQGPFVEAPAQFGYQGRLPLRDILRTGMAAIDAHCTQAFAGKQFAALDPAEQVSVLKTAESGALELEGISSKTFFTNFLAEVRNGYFSDPVHGGNKDMGSWKMIGYPGMRADYINWVTVRDKPYPLPPVDLAGRRS